MTGMTSSVGDQSHNRRQRHEVNLISVMAISIVESVLVAINHVIAIVNNVTTVIVVIIIAIGNTEIVIIRLKNKAEVSWNNIETEQIRQNKNLKRNKDPTKKRTI